MANNKQFDVIIIGGSYAGLSAAMALGRSMRDVLVIDSGMPCNMQTPHSHNFLTHDGEKPAVIAERAKSQVLNYSTVNFHEGIAITGKKNGQGFTVGTLTGDEFHSKKLLFATGIKDIMPDIKGFSECWGITAVHCPYCHGYEFRGQKTGIIASGDRAFHLASLVHNLTDDLTLLTTGKPGFNAEQLAKLERYSIRIVEDGIAEFQHENGYLKHVVFDNGNRIDFKAVYAATPFEQHSDIPVSLGCELTEHGYIKIDHFQQTTVPGVFACGDNSNMMRSVANAVHTGNLTGALINKELTEETFGGF